MLSRFPRVVALAAFCVPAIADPAWTVTRTADFDLWSDAGPRTVTSTLAWFEQLHAFSLQHIGLQARNVTIIVFRSTGEYDEFRPMRSAAAFCAGLGSRNYIVMSGDTASSAIAAHEYAHALMHSSDLQLPLWLSEGLAEIYSSVHIGPVASTIGGDLPEHSAILARRPWMPLGELLAARDQPQDVGLFYAESWALTQMLLFSPEYASRFRELVAAFASGAAGAQALVAGCAKPIDAIERDLRAWTTLRFPGISLGGVKRAPLADASSAAAPFERRRLMAEVMLASGRSDRAAALLNDLQHEAPRDAGVPAALGEIALRRADKLAALRAWKQAIDNGTRDPKLCFRYAALAEQCGHPEAEIRPVLERAVALDPAFDDARYKLALIEINAGEFEAGISQLSAMRGVAPGRAYSYWSAMANALNELGRRDDARAAAAEAGRHAASAAERDHAAELAYMAATDLAVRFERDDSGATRLVTARAPHGASDWNPFIEPRDQMRHIEGMLDNIDCSGGPARLTVTSAGRKITLVIPDPARVQMRHAPAEFVCGPQSARVAIDYAAQNSAVRAMDFK